MKHETFQIKINNRAFTLLEFLIVVMLVIIIGAFAVPSYKKAELKAYERDAINQLTLLHAANLTYLSNNGKFFDQNTTDLKSININLRTNIISTGLTYQYTFVPPSGYEIRASWDETGATYDFTVKVTNADIANTNPCCSAGSCPSLAAC